MARRGATLFGSAEEASTVRNYSPGAMQVNALIATLDRLRLGADRIAAWVGTNDRPAIRAQLWRSHGRFPCILDLLLPGAFRIDQQLGSKTPCRLSDCLITIIKHGFHSAFFRRSARRS
jgi:hypothetical protein